GGGGMGIWVTIKHVFLIKPSKECCGYAERRLCRFKMEIKGVAYAELIKELKESENNTSLDLQKKVKRHWLHMSSPVYEGASNNKEDTPDAAKQSLKKIRMPLPSWRRADYVKSKYLSPFTHIANTTIKTDKSPVDDQSFNEKTTKPNPISYLKDLILVDEFKAVGAAPEVEKSKEAMKQISEYLSDSMRHVPTNHDIEEDEESKVETLEDLFQKK
ncbi:MLO-like protein 4, partial [Tanacetum coccineum]